jgi:hypothetical protein
VGYIKYLFSHFFYESCDPLMIGRIPGLDQDSNCIYNSFKVLSHYLRLCESIETVLGILLVLLIAKMKFDGLKI